MARFLLVAIWALSILPASAQTPDYSIQAIRDNIESNVVGPKSITPLDTFTPAVPSALTASVGIGAVELAWSRNIEPNFKEYRVLRSEESGPFVEIAHGLIRLRILNIEIEPCDLPEANGLRSYRQMQRILRNVHNAFHERHAAPVAFPGLR